MGLPRDYAPFLRDLKDRIRAARLKAVLAVNRQMLALYWDLGRRVVERQRKRGWGAGIIERLSHDIRAEFPGIQGFSPSNIWRMKAFYLAWPRAGSILAEPARESGSSTPTQAATKSDGSILAQPVRESRDPSLAAKAVAELPWGHNVILLEKLKNSGERLWYAQRALINGWSRAMLVHQIESALHLRQGQALTNFSRTLPSPQSDLAQETLKDDYALDFLATARSRERDIERSLLEHVQGFLLALGTSFAFVGRQHHLEVGGEDFYLDLLFYHLRLRCFVVIELKAGPFKPEHAGKMGFYLAAADDLLRRPEDGPTIGIILCRSRNRVVAEYALRDMNKPIGISCFRGAQALPASLKNALPSLSELERAARARC